MRSPKSIPSTCSVRVIQRVTHPQGRLGQGQQDRLPGPSRSSSVELDVVAVGGHREELQTGLHLATPPEKC